MYGRGGCVGVIGVGKGLSRELESLVTFVSF
jgi:hypothetical protein